MGGRIRLRSHDAGTFSGLCGAACAEPVRSGRLLLSGLCGAAASLLLFRRAGWGSGAGWSLGVAFRWAEACGFAGAVGIVTLISIILIYSSFMLL